MKKLLLTLLSSFVLAAPAFALVGGPWDSNIFGNTTTANPSNINGTYQGTIKGKNLSGVIQFATSVDGAVNSPGTTTETATVTGTGSSAKTVWTWTTTDGTYPGIATIFIEGGIAVASVDVTANIGSRKLAGVLDGGSTRAATLTVSNGAGATWTVVNNLSFSGAFSAKLSKSWANNSFTGKGGLVIRKFDLASFTAAVAADPATDPTVTDFIASVYTPVKVAGVKTTDVVNSYTATIPANTEPTISAY